MTLVFFCFSSFYEKGVIEMEINEAVVILESLTQSLRDNPSQFHITVNVTGQKITSHGGTGLSITATGGGIGSTTIGQTVSLDGAGIEISQGRGKQAMNDQFNALIQTLTQIIDQLREPSPDRGIISRLYESLRNTWVPGVITSVVGSVLAGAIGL
jgi:hypothetical protein